ncbi:hypothetical protein PIB30_012888, partial [Stylosanthes scabra]|nr:hypothetical protein [Stylosanthes scabra]
RVGTRTIAGDRQWFDDMMGDLKVGGPHCMLERCGSIGKGEVKYMVGMEHNHSSLWVVQAAPIDASGQSPSGHAEGNTPMFSSAMQTFFVGLGNLDI